MNPRVPAKSDARVTTKIYLYFIFHKLTNTTMRIQRSVLSALFVSSLFLFNACSKQEQSQPGTDTTKAVATAVKEGQGVALVRAIDTAGKTITLAHNNIPNIMDAMTMDYPVSDPAMLRAVAVGDSVSFTLEDRGDGSYLVTTITQIKKG